MLSVLGCRSMFGAGREMSFGRLCGRRRGVLGRSFGRISDFVVVGVLRRGYLLHVTKDAHRKFETAVEELRVS